MLSIGPLSGLLVWQRAAFKRILPIDTLFGLMWHHISTISSQQSYLIMQNHISSERRWLNGYRTSLEPFFQNDEEFLKSIDCLSSVILGYRAMDDSLLNRYFNQTMIRDINKPISYFPRGGMSASEGLAGLITDVSLFHKRLVTIHCRFIASPLKEMVASEESDMEASKSDDIIRVPSESTSESVAVDSTCFITPKAPSKGAINERGVFTTTATTDDVIMKHTTLRDLPSESEKVTSDIVMTKSDFSGGEKSSVKSDFVDGEKSSTKSDPSGSKKLKKSDSSGSKKSKKSDSSGSKKSTKKDPTKPVFEQKHYKMQRDFILGQAELMNEAVTALNCELSTFETFAYLSNLNSFCCPAIERIRRLTSDHGVITAKMVPIPGQKRESILTVLRSVLKLAHCLHPNVSSWLKSNMPALIKYTIEHLHFTKKNIANLERMLFKECVKKIKVDKKKTNHCYSFNNRDLVMESVRKMHGISRGIHPVDWRYILPCCWLKFTKELKLTRAESSAIANLVGDYLIGDPTNLWWSTLAALRGATLSRNISLYSVDEGWEYMSAPVGSVHVPLTQQWQQYNVVTLHGRDFIRGAATTKIHDILLFHYGKDCIDEMNYILCPSGSDVVSMDALRILDYSKHRQWIDLMPLLKRKRPQHIVWKAFRAEKLNVKTGKAMIYPLSDHSNLCATELGRIRRWYHNASIGACYSNLARPSRTQPGYVKVGSIFYSDRSPVALKHNAGVIDFSDPKKSFLTESLNAREEKDISLCCRRRCSGGTTWKTDW